MKEKNLRSVLRKVNIVKLLLPAAVLTAALLLLLVHPINNNINAASIDDLSQTEAQYASGNRYIQYTADTLYYAGIDYRVNDKIKAQVYYCLENGRCYFFIISTDKIPKGRESVSRIPLSARLLHNHNMYRRIIASLSDNIDFAPQGLEAVCSDILISQYDFAHGFTTYYTAALLALCVIFGIALLFGILTAVFPSVSPPVLYLRRYGSRTELFAAAKQEFRLAPPPKISGLYLTDRFIFHIGRTFADIIPLENITWGYTSNEIRNFHGKPRIHCTLCLLTESRRTYRIRRISNKIAAEILSELQTKYPSIMADGFMR